MKTVVNAEKRIVVSTDDGTVSAEGLLLDGELGADEPYWEFVFWASRYKEAVASLNVYETGGMDVAKVAGMLLEPFRKIYGGESDGNV